MIVASDTWADFAGTIWAEPTTRWIVYAALVVGLGVGGWRVWRKVRPWLEGISRDLAVVKHEVKNDHKTNFREEQDERHEANAGTLTTIRDDVKLILRTLGEHGYRIGELEHEVENTRDRRPEQ
ncbi:hypothetical protein [Curtobacterium sp. VKM Ac-1376]|uniref:hypothetical protein n=1 Tax=Curtobacterium sp. VKM Ac-1376 TaxID=123312 RepID=UPI00188C4A39|nr:hypothetical protein [Curtobacterium sp. VKM Ac-1376]MBF4613278.1 hypothetical protein [Curtobacterium sp. VKM Ac-1376]